MCFFEVFLFLFWGLNSLTWIRIFVYYVHSAPFAGILSVKIKFREYGILTNRNLQCVCLKDQPVRPSNFQLLQMNQ